MTKVLVVDDNPDIIYSVKASLEDIDKKYEVEIANSGEKCLKKLKEYRPDIILLDIMMPDMDGWAVAASVKSNDETKDIPIIFLTAKTDDLSKGMGSLTAADYVEKPFDQEDLDRRIKKAIA